MEVEKCGISDIFRKVLVIFQGKFFLAHVFGVDLDFIELIGGSEDVEVAFLLIPLVLVGGVEDEFLGDGVLHNYAHLLDLLGSGVHHVEPGCLVLEAEDEGIFLLVLELWAQLLLNVLLDAGNILVDFGGCFYGF